MEPEEKELLKRSVAIGEENNDMLRSIKRSMRLARFMSLLYWLIIIGSAVGAYYIIQPYLDKIISTYNSTTGSLNGGLNGILDNLKKLQK